MKTIKRTINKIKYKNTAHTRTLQSIQYSKTIIQLYGYTRGKSNSIEPLPLNNTLSRTA